MTPVWILLIATVLICSHFISCEPGEDPPRIETYPKDQTVASGGIAVFFCTAVGNPNPQIKWRKNGKKIKTQRYSTWDIPNGSVLRIEPVRAGRDDATYECVAKNGVGEPVRALADLNVLPDSLPDGFPRFIRQPNMQGIEKGRSALLPCQAEGDPEPTIKWLKNMIPLDMTIPRYSLVQGSSLQITDAEEEDQGNYECMAENTHGSALSEMTTLFVRVRRVPPYFSIRPENLYEVMPGSSLNLTCVAVGSPMPFVKWRKGLMVITPDHTIPIGRNVLVLTDISESNNYTCIAASKLGNIETTAQVLVQALPRPPTNVRISDVTATSARLSWSYDIGSENIIYYVIQYKPKQANQEYREISGITTMFYTVRDLSPYTEYEFYVIAVNGSGRGPPSTPVVATTGETEPGSAPRNVQARPLSSSTVVIQWDPPKEPNGHVTGYKVYYTTRPNLPTSAWNTQPVDNNQLTTISDLTPQTIYTIRIQAFTSRGPGPHSAPVQVKTQQGGHALASQLANLYMDSAISAVQYALQNEKLEPTRLSEYTYIYKDKDNGVDGTVKYFDGSLSGLSKVERHSDCDGPRTISGTTAIDCTLVFDRLLASHKGKFSYGLHEANINVKGNIHSIYIKVGIVKSISERNPQVKSLYFIKYGSMDTYFTGLGPLYNQTKVLHDIYETVFKTEAIISIQSGFRRALNVTVASLPMPVD